MRRVFNTARHALLASPQAAQQFRKRKKEYISTLEQDLEELRSEHAGLRAKCTALLDENKVLRRENTSSQADSGSLEEATAYVRQSRKNP